MTMLFRFVTVAALPMAAAGCAGRPAAAPFDLTVLGTPTACSVKVEGRAIAMDELSAIARREARPGRRARIDATTPETPYRCLGAAIYTVQRAGFVDVGFVGAPSSNDE